MKAIIITCILISILIFLFCNMVYVKSYIPDKWTYTIFLTYKEYNGIKDNYKEYEFSVDTIYCTVSVTEGNLSTHKLNPSESDLAELLNVLRVNTADKLKTKKRTQQTDDHDYYLLRLRRGGRLLFNIDINSENEIKEKDKEKFKLITDHLKKILNTNR